MDDIASYMQHLNGVLKPLMFFAPAIVIFMFQDWSESCGWLCWIIRAIGVVLIGSGLYVLF